MTSTIQPSQLSQQTAIWLRGLLTVAWADGHFDPEEQALISALTHQELTSSDSDKPNTLEPVTPEELAATLGQDPDVAENFLRTAVMVALVDGTYSPGEDELLNQYCQALKLQSQVLTVLRLTLSEPCETQPAESVIAVGATQAFPASLEANDPHDLLNPVRSWLDKMEVHDPKVAHFLCQMIPSQCPFERDIHVFGRKVAHIPALCKLNPLYEQLVSLRFRALSYLADECGEDVTPYC